MSTLNRAHCLALAAHVSATSHKHSISNTQQPALAAVLQTLCPHVIISSKWQQISRWCGVQGRARWERAEEEENSRGAANKGGTCWDDKQQIIAVRKGRAGRVRASGEGRVLRGRRRGGGGVPCVHYGHAGGRGWLRLGDLSRAALFDAICSSVWSTGAC